MRKNLLVAVVALLAGTAYAAEERGPAVRQGGQIGELRTFIANGLSSAGRVMFTTSAAGWFTIMEVCGNTTRSNEDHIDVQVFAGDLHVATLAADEGGAQPKCVAFPSGMVLPRLTQVRCEGSEHEECWITGVCSRDCNLP